MKVKILFAVAAVLFALSCKTSKTLTEGSVAPVSAAVSEVKVAELEPELEKGKNLYENNCAGCHKLFQPKRFTKEEWKPILVRMQKFTNLEDVEMVLISDYINSQL